MSKKKLNYGDVVFILRADHTFGFLIPKFVAPGIIKSVVLEKNDKYLYTVEDTEGNIYNGHYNPFYDNNNNTFFRTPEDQIKIAKEHLDKLNFIRIEEVERLKRLYSILEQPKIDKSKIEKRINMQIKVLKSLNYSIDEVQRRLNEYSDALFNLYY